MDPRFWSVVFLVLMLCALALEMLTPSMGGFSLGALACAGLSVFMSFRHSDAMGFLMLALNLLLFPVGLWLCIHIMKRSPLMLHREHTTGVRSTPDAPSLAYLQGREGRALTPLRPSGAALIGDQRVDVVTEGRFVEPETLVKVIQVEGSRVVVEPIGQK